MKRKHIIITKLFDFGGSNTHLKALIKYFENVDKILVLENSKELIHLNNIENKDLIKTIIVRKLHAYAHLSYLFTSNLRELFFILKSIVCIFSLSIKHGFADVTIAAVEPEKHLYLLWLPFIKVTYILHSTPLRKYTWFTSFTCNVRLGEKKKIVTVSHSNKAMISENWEITDSKRPYIFVIHNCVLDKKSKDETVSQVNTTKNIVTLGHLIEYKNPFIWLEVAKKVTSLRDNIHFFWMGSGPLLQHFIEATKEIPCISFPGILAQDSSPFNNAIIYYQPSLNETHGIAVLEAMCNSLPCIVANTGGLPESVKNNFNGTLVNPYSVDENVSALLHLIDNNELRKSFGLNSFKRYQELFTFNTFKIKMDRVYK